MADRPYLTSAEAATYCGFKTIGGIQQAVRRGKLKPAGRRGGTGTYVFAKEDLDAFLTGGLQPHERLFVPPELNEAARVAALAPAAPAPRSRQRPAPVREATAAPPPHKSPPPEATLSPEVPAAPRPSSPSSPSPAPSPALNKEPAASKAPRPAARPAPKPAPPRGRKPATKDDPVARIVQALSGAARKLEKNAKRAH
jgi:hypothetical protein